MKEEILISSGSFGVLLLLLDFFFVVSPDLSHGPFTHHPPYFSTCSTMPICPYVPGMFTLPFNSPRYSPGAHSSGFLLSALLLWPRTTE